MDNINEVEETDLSFDNQMRPMIDNSFNMTDMMPEAHVKRFISGQN